MSVTSLQAISPRLAPWPSDVRWTLRARTFIVALLELLWLDLVVRFGFSTLRQSVARVKVSPNQRDYDALNLVRMAVRDACVFYFKQVYCLQRSAAVTRMLRRRGIRAELVIGYRPVPVSSHAWVELDGVVIWDHMVAHQFLRVIDRV